MKRLTPALLISLLLLTACGQTQDDRVATGALIGAGTGALVAAPFGAPFVGAIVGTGVGIGVAAATGPEQLNWGDPIWQHWN